MKLSIKLVIFDLDNTLTTGPTIWELIHRENGTWKSHGTPYWKAYKKGEFGINVFIKKDVACWKGLSIRKLKNACTRVRFIPNIRKTVLALHRAGIKTALISSSVDQFAQYVAKKFDIDHVFANPVTIRKGRLTGEVTLKVPGNGKARVTALLRKYLHLKKREVLAVGDSIHDFPLFNESGVSVSFHDSHTHVKHRVDHVIGKKQLYMIVSIVTAR